MATKREMTVDDHVQTALQFLEHSQREFAAGEPMQGSEKLWGAASHSVMAIAKQRGWRHGSYRDRVTAVDRLAEENDEPLLVAGFALAHKFHANLYYDFMENETVEHDRPMVQDFVRRILILVENSTP